MLEEIKATDLLKIIMRSGFMFIRKVQFVM